MFSAESPQGAPAPSPAWGHLVAALDAFGKSAGPFSSAIESAVATGGTLRPEVAEAYVNWLKAAERLKQRAGAIIEADPKLQAAIETSGVGFSGFGRPGELEAYFAQVTSSVKRIVDLLKDPIPLEVAGRTLHGFGALGQVAGWAARFAGPVWQGLLKVLRLPVVTAAGATAVGVQGLDGVLNSEVESYYASVEKLRQLCLDKKLTVEECKALMPPEPFDWKGAVIWGGVALGALALWFRRPTPAPALGNFAKTRYRRKWRQI